MAVDVVVVGAGVAGLTVATALAGSREVLVVAAGDGSTRWAQGGVAAAYAADDDPARHARDTLVAGGDHGDPAAVACLTEEGPQRVAELVALGAAFDRDAEGRLLLGREGGHDRSRVLHAGGDATGAEVDRVLWAQARRPGVRHLDARVVGVLVTGRRVTGVVLADGTRVHARATVLATGGLGHCYPTTTNPAGVTGDGLALALLAGATLADLEFVQLHPTALAVGGTGQVPLVTEALRGAGAVLRDAAGGPVVTGHPSGDLAPRDVVARAVHAAMRRDEAAYVRLDTRGVRDLERRFPTVAATCRARGIDTTDIPVAPAQHYLCGGVVTDRWGATDVPGLYAVGEVAATGVHGANRLASNSLLEGLVFGRRLAARLVLDLPDAPAGEPEARLLGAATARSAEARAALGEAGGLVRDGAALAAALERLRADPAPETTWLVAVALLGAAARREESRGCHLRTDFPDTLGWWRRRVAVRLDGAGVPHAVVAGGGRRPGRAA